MSNLNELIQQAELKKPAMGESCNRCGWCCLTQPCAIAVGLGVSEMTIPCPYLTDGPEQYTCSLVEQFPALIVDLAINKGCDAKTQMEAINEQSS